MKIQASRPFRWFLVAVLGFLDASLRQLLETLYLNAKRLHLLGETLSFSGYFSG